LRKKIAINDKIEETERLKEFIVMEEEQLAEKYKTFDEDKESFSQYIQQVKRDADDVALEVTKLIMEKNRHNETIRQLELDIKEVETEMNKKDEQLQTCADHKTFLDKMAEYAGKKENGEGEESEVEVNTH
jgi:predicted neutral ceramidase superfamily lipid hydrolase